MIIETPQQKLEREIRGIQLRIFKENGKKKPDMKKIEKLNKKLIIKFFELSLYRKQGEP